jgi:UDPglucose 6-dehydrogenase
LAFKADTDDMREAPSLVLIAELLRRGAAITVYDPVAMPAARFLIDATRVTFASSQVEALEGSDALLIVTDWKEFRSPDFDAVKSLLKSPMVIDGRNLYEPRAMQALGIEYIGIGRGGPHRGDAGSPAVLG